MNKAEAHQQKLETEGNWKPSDISPEEQIVSMMAKLQKPDKKDKSTSGKDKKSGKEDKGGKKGKQGGDDKQAKPPFWNSPGKEGDSKTWKSKTYYYCDFEHKEGHWVRHKPSECKAKKQGSTGHHKSETDKGSKVAIDRNKLKTSMAAVFQASGYDVDIESIFDAAVAASSKE